MLEIRNLNKTYITKGAPPVHALKDVSVKLENRGMVFVLGKSGSGKSTFLNVVGGLDRYDSGEIIIKGKSSSEFRGSDFDSYRNTYLGFIFQEYNLINELTIGENIGLAIQLQGEKATEERINEILELVELGGMKDRMPLQISGGQRQRVAIARALIKNPEIIMADEPTGALDSATGASIFTTLQNLAKTRLVLIVSHDREFAELYGDRIIEFSDGRIVSDMIKSGEGEGKSKEEEEILRLERVFQESKAAGVSEESLVTVKEIIESKKREQKSQKPKNRGIFVDTEEDKLDLASDDKSFKLIKSRMPQKNAIKMARSSMKHKRVRLVISIFLSVLAVSLFGFSFIVGNFSSRGVVKGILRDNDYKYMVITKSAEEENAFVRGGYSREVAFSDKNEQRIADITNDGYGKFYLISDYVQYGNGLTDSRLDPEYFPNYFTGLVLSENLDKMGFDIPTVYGRYPAAYDEILISNYVAEGFLHMGMQYYENGEIKVLTPTHINDILSYTITIRNVGIPLKIVGIINFPIEKYSELKYTATSEKVPELLTKEFDERRDFEISYIYGLPQLLDYSFFYSYGYYTLKVDMPKLKKSGDGVRAVSIRGTDYQNAEPLLKEFHYLGSEGETTPRKLEKGEIIVDLTTYLESKAMYDGTHDWSDSRKYSLNAEELKELAEDLNIFDKKMRIDVCEDSLAYRNRFYKYHSGDYKVVGVTSGPFGNYYSGMVIFYDEDYEKATADTNPEQIFVYLANMRVANELVDSFVGKFSSSFKGLDLNYTVRLPYAHKVMQMGEYFETFALVFLVMSLIICLFAALLLLNFITASVTYKKKEIGILRAIGARHIDVISIFLWEGVIIGAIVLGISVIFTIIAIIVFNNLMGALLGLMFTLLVMEIGPLLIMALVCFGNIALASILPSIKVASLKPMDAIRSL